MAQQYKYVHSFLHLISCEYMMECSSGILEALNAKIYGNGSQTIVLSHGFGTDQTIWHFVIPVLAIYFKVLVYDLVFSPNVNPSLYDATKYHKNFNAYAQDLTCILDQLHLHDTVFIGHSMSAMVGSIAATERPDLFQHLFLLNGSPRYLNAPHYPGGLSRPQVDATLTSIQTNFSGWAHSLAPAAVGVNFTAETAEFESSLKRMDPKIALDVAETIFLVDNRPFLHHVQVRSTIIQTLDDIFVPTKVAHHMKKMMKQAEAKLIFIAGTGHFPVLTAYVPLLEAIKSVLHLPTNQY